MVFFECYLMQQYFWCCFFFIESDISKCYDIAIGSLHRYTVHFVRAFKKDFLLNSVRTLVDKTDLFQISLKTIWYSVIVYFGMFLLASCAFVNVDNCWQHSVLTTELISTHSHQYFCMAHIKGHINMALALFCCESTVSSDITPDRWDWFWSPSVLHWLEACCCIVVFKACASLWLELWSQVIDLLVIASAS